MGVWGCRVWGLGGLGVGGQGFGYRENPDLSRTPSGMEHTLRDPKGALEGTLRDILRLE